MSNAAALTGSFDPSYGQIDKGWPADAPTRPYIELTATEAGAFALDALLCCMLDRQSMYVGMSKIIISINKAVKQPEWLKISPCSSILALVTINALAASRAQDVQRIMLVPRLMDAPSPPVALPDLTIGYGELLEDIHNDHIWSWRELGKILKVSHTELQRIVDGKSPSSALGERIDEFYKVYKAIKGAARENTMVIKRALTTRVSQRGKSAENYIYAGDFRKAFSAAMDILSPRPNVAQMEKIPLRWYNEPSRAIDDFIENELDGK